MRLGLIATCVLGLEEILEAELRAWRQQALAGLQSEPGAPAPKSAASDASGISPSVRSRIFSASASTVSSPGLPTSFGSVRQILPSKWSTP